MDKKVNVLGTEYAVSFHDYKDKPIFEERSIGGYSGDVFF